MTTQENSFYNIWGLTGGVAAGKSKAATFFKEEGIPVIDADQIARKLSQKGGAAHEAIVKRFGTDQRDQLRAIVFSDARARKDLEAILHPLIQVESLREMHKIAQTLGSSQAPILYEAALLVETDKYRDFKELIVVDAPHELRIQRLMKREGFTLEQADAIIHTQISDEKRKAVATVVLENMGTLEELRNKVASIARQMKGLVHPRSDAF